MVRAIILPLAYIIGLVNGWGGIVAAVWLMFKGEWRLVLWAGVQLFVGVLLLLLLLLPSIWLGRIALAAVEKRRWFLAGIFNSLSIAYNMVLMAVWGYSYLYYYSQRALPDALIPVLLLSYGPATGPWTYMADRQEPLSIVAILFLQIAYLVTGAMLIFSKQAWALTAVGTYLGIMGVGLVVCIILSWFFLGGAAAVSLD